MNNLETLRAAATAATAAAAKAADALAREEAIIASMEAMTAEEAQRLLGGLRPRLVHFYTDYGQWEEVYELELHFRPHEYGAHGRHAVTDGEEAVIRLLNARGENAARQGLRALLVEELRVGNDPKKNREFVYGHFGARIDAAVTHVRAAIRAHSNSFERPEAYSNTLYNLKRPGFFAGWKARDAYRREKRRLEEALAAAKAGLPAFEKEYSRLSAAFDAAVEAEMTKIAAELGLSL